jgi:hypothetical protein
MLIVALIAVLPVFSVALGEAARFVGAWGESFVHERALHTAKTLPAAQLFGERATRAVGDIPETEVFVDLE